jgi:hypothetical protein
LTGHGVHFVAVYIHSLQTGYGVHLRTGYGVRNLRTGYGIHLHIGFGVHSFQTGYCIIHTGRWVQPMSCLVQRASATESEPEHRFGFVPKCRGLSPCHFISGLNVCLGMGGDG